MKYFLSSCSLLTPSFLVCILLPHILCGLYFPLLHLIVIPCYFDVSQETLHFYPTYLPPNLCFLLWIQASSRHVEYYLRWVWAIIKAHGTLLQADSMPFLESIRALIRYVTLHHSYTVVYCTVLYCSVLYCTVLYCTVLYYTVLYCTVLYYTVLYCIAL